jgi:uncharacterized protein GlcG (DUF336 family)
MHARILLTVALLTASLTSHAEEAFVTTRSLSAASANQLAMASLQACAQQGYQVAAAVVDRHGNLLAFVRDPLSGHHTIDVATRKAYTAASFQTATLELQGRNFDGLRHAERVLLIGGGVPIRVGGHVYGAVGVSGAPAKKLTGDIDDACARQGLEAIREALEFAE